MITIVDSGCGKGKTSYAIQYMNENIFTRFIYITPFLDEIQRVKESCTTRHFSEPNTGKGYGSKTNDFYNLISEGDNVVSTHSLFRGLSSECIDTIKEMEYVLIMDEVADVVENLSISKDDIQMLINEKIINVGEDNKVNWISDTYNGKFLEYKNSILNGDVYLYNNAMILWTFPVNIFKAFKDVFILTYMFKGQIQRYYYDFHNVPYQYKSVQCIGYDPKKVGSRKTKLYELVDYVETNGSEYKDLINIYEGNLNDIGTRKTALSKSWFDKGKNRDILKRTKNNTGNYFRNIVKGKSNLNMWTTFKDYKPKLQGERYTKGYVPCNARATNDYKHKTNCAYLCNRFYVPTIKNFFMDKGVDIDEDTWALSELIQWLFRSAIRENNEINLYIPSSRMRGLLNEWLNK